LLHDRVCNRLNAGLSYKNGTAATASSGTPGYRKSGRVNGATSLSNGIISAVAVMKCSKQSRMRHGNCPKIHVFKFPTDEALKQKWILYIPVGGTSFHQHDTARKQHVAEVLGI